MNPLLALQLLSAALSDAASLLPEVQNMVNNGTITPDQQATVLAQYNSLKTLADGQFAGPEWAQS